jgi:hypothetical protein
VTSSKTLTTTFMPPTSIRSALATTDRRPAGVSQSIWKLRTRSPRAARIPGR